MRGVRARARAAGGPVERAAPARDLGPAVSLGGLVCLSVRGCHHGGRGQSGAPGLRSHHPVPAAHVRESAHPGMSRRRPCPAGAPRGRPARGARGRVRSPLRQSPGGDSAHRPAERCGRHPRAAPCPDQLPPCRPRRPKPGLPPRGPGPAPSAATSAPGRPAPPRAGRAPSETNSELQRADDLLFLTRFSFHLPIYFAAVTSAILFRDFNT